MPIFSRFSLTLFTVAALQLAPPAFAQEPRERAQTYVERVALTTDPSDALARWDGEVCVGAVGLAPEQAQALVDRVSVRARAVGLRPGASGCRANVMVIYAPDSDVVTREIVDQRRDLLGFYPDDERITAGRAAMDDFANTPRATRGSGREVRDYLARERHYVQESVRELTEAGPFRKSGPEA